MTKNSMLFIGMIFFSSCFSGDKKLPLNLSAAIKKYRSIIKDSLTDVVLKPNSKFYLELKKTSIIRDSFEIENIGNKKFVIDYLNTSINNLKILTDLIDIEPRKSKKILFEYNVDNNFIEKDGRLSFMILVVGNSKNNISVLRVGGIIK